MKKDTIQKTTKRFPSYIRKQLYKIIDHVLVAKGWIIVINPIFKSHKPENNKIYNLVSSVKKEARSSLLDIEFFHLYTIINKTRKIDGDIAEVGVYRGGSAKIICETTKKRIHLFDTFEGIPKPRPDDSLSKLKKGDYKSSYNDVKNYLRKYRNVNIYKGLFPSTSKPVENRKFSLVHLDVDLYESTLKCLEFFYTRMSKGGVIICHDYSGLRGVKKAVDKFFKNKPEIIMEIEPLAGSSQCLIIKV